MYIYASYKLWLLYGIAIASASLVVAVGLCVIISRGASYSNDFSTIVRVTRHAFIDPDVDTRDDGRDPLVKSLADATCCVRPKLFKDVDLEVDAPLVAVKQAHSVSIRSLSPPSN